MITAADREAAVAYWKSQRIGTAASYRAIRDGERDDSDLIQAFAKHRADSARALVEALNAIVEGRYERPLGTIWRQDKVRSKYDRCLHGQMMCEPCEACIDAHCEAALRSSQSEEKAG